MPFHQGNNSCQQGYKAIYKQILHLYVGLLYFLIINNFLNPSKYYLIKDIRQTKKSLFMLITLNYKDVYYLYYLVLSYSVWSL